MSQASHPWVVITEILRYHINAPSANHGLVVGSLTGEREGVFGVKADELGDGIAAAYQNGPPGYGASPVWSFSTAGDVPTEQATWGAIKALFR